MAEDNPFEYFKTKGVEVLFHINFNRSNFLLYFFVNIVRQSVSGNYFELVN